LFLRKPDKTVRIDDAMNTEVKLQGSFNPIDTYQTKFFTEDHIRTSAIFLPKKSCCIMCNLNQLKKNNLSDSYDLILADPPWSNKSAKRKRKYATYENSENLNSHFQSIPFELATKYIAIWVTNNSKVIEFVENYMLELNFHRKLTIYWVKITCKNELIVPLDSLHKKPYEKLMVFEKGSINTLPEIICLFGVPSIHSQKPFLHFWLAQYLAIKSPIEFFARTTVGHGWTSCGNDPLEFNSLEYFEFEND